jgi:biopolymer transport protein ExbD
MAGGNKRKTPDINASSQADIAFLLLVFFLVATTMNTDKGLSRVLPPIPPEDVKVEDQKQKERNVLLVFVNGAGQLMVGDEFIDIRNLKDRAKEFIVNATDAEDMPEKDVVLLKGDGDFLTVLPGYFMITFPEDAHSPAAKLGEECETYGKIVAKVPVK